MRAIRVMSFNVWDTGEPDPWQENPRAAWSKRRPWVIYTIHRVRPALIGFQECHPARHGPVRSTSTPSSAWLIAREGAHTGPTTCSFPAYPGAGVNQ